MPTSAERRRRWAVDTSVAVAALDASHVAHAACREAVRTHRPRLAGHAAIETFSVLTRMPGGLAISPTDAVDAVGTIFGEPLWLTPEQTKDLYARLRTLGLSGGAVYDALVATATTANRCRLLTRDLRARPTYELLGVEVDYLT